MIAFPCECETLIGSLDDAPGTTGLLIVSGGNEPRFGAHRGMALLAQRVAAQGWPVFRFDRRGVGDSSGENGGWASSAPDIAAAIATFRREAPHITRVVGFGNCDAATALARFALKLGITDVVLTNPWLGDEADALPSRAAIRHRYANLIFEPRTWGRLLRGRISLSKALAGVRKLGRHEQDGTGSLRWQVKNDLLNQDLCPTVILASGDATAITFNAATDGGKAFGIDYIRLDTASHSFAREGDAAALSNAIITVLNISSPRP